MAEKVTRVLHSQGLNAAKYNRLARIAVLCGQVRADAWQRCSGLSTVLQSPYEIRDAWMAEGYDWHGLPARLGKATLADALGDIAASREAAKVPVKKAIRHRTRGNCAERERLYSLLKQNRWTEDPFLHRQMRTAVARRPVPCDQPDCGRRGLLHHQGLARPGLGVPPRSGTRPTHRHSA